MDFISLFFSHLIFSTVKKKIHVSADFFQFEDSKGFHFHNKAVKAELPYWIGQSSSLLSLLQILLSDATINCK